MQQSTHTTQYTRNTCHLEVYVGAISTVPPSATTATARLCDGPSPEQAVRGLPRPAILPLLCKGCTSTPAT
eukprot:10389752-Alexandrium_andersonii.AAC.1